jgi:hypothetical protein
MKSISILLLFGLLNTCQFNQNSDALLNENKSSETNKIQRVLSDEKEDEGLNIVTKDLSYSKIYLKDESNTEIFNTTLTGENNYTLVFEGVEGFKMINDKIFPSLIIEFVDDNGVVLFTNNKEVEDLIVPGLGDGVSKEHLPLNIMHPIGKLNNPCNLNARLKDLKSEKEILVKASFKRM